MVFSEKNDPKLAIRLMRAGTREYLLLPFERGAVAQALARITASLDERAGEAVKPQEKKVKEACMYFSDPKEDRV